ncbi:MAG: beta-galactosidase [Pseudomonadota bacterium]
MLGIFKVPTALVAVGMATAVGAATHTVTVNEDGTYDPVWLNIQDGDTVTWSFPDRRRSIVRVKPDGTGFPAWCDAYLPYDPNDPNEFTGPMPVAAAGVFALGPKAEGLTVHEAGDTSAPCWDPDPAVMADRTADNGRFVCGGSGPPSAPLQEILDSDALVGVFLRFEWDEIEPAPGVYDWTDFDAQVQRVVDAGKMFSLAFKAGKAGHPNWLHNDLGLPINSFEDGGSTSDSCDISLSLTSPTEPLYADRYSMFLQAVASRLMENPAWYRALAYIKPSGANFTSHENRLPKVCSTECAICNTQVWADAGYTPQGLYDFYTQQFQDIAAAFPGKTMSYQLIQDGFPRVLSEIEYKGCTTKGCEDDIPKAHEQTETILNLGAANHGLDFVVQHNGLRPYAPTGCYGAGVHPVVGTLRDFKAAPNGCPNPWVLKAGSIGQITGFQTTNTNGILTGEDLDSAFENALQNSDAVFVEAYEQVLWKIIENGGDLDPGAVTPRTLNEWSAEFIQRRRIPYFLNQGLPKNLPRTHSHTFTRTIGAKGAEIYHYVDPARCGDVPANYGVIRILP